jgi:hypothetical protein
MRIKNINNKIELSAIFEFEYVYKIDEEVNWIGFKPGTLAASAAREMNGWDYIDIKENFNSEVLNVILDNLSIFKFKYKKKVIEYGLM